MANLLDIAPSKRTIKTSFGDLDVPGINLTDLAYILKKHPELLELIKTGEMTFDASSILDLGLGVSSSFLAAGLGHAGNEAVEERCRKFKIEDALDIGEAIIDESFPKGVQSFLERVTSLALGMKSRVEQQAS